MKFALNLPKLGSKKVSIDWGSQALKIIHASKVKSSYLITDFIYQKQEENLSAIILEIWRSHKLPFYNITISLDGPLTLIRVVDFPKMDKKSLRESLGYELSRYIPFSQEEVYFDFHILEKETGSENIRLLIASVKKDFADGRISILKEAGIIPAKITLGPISLANGFSKLSPSGAEPAGILDLGFAYSAINIIRNNNIHLSREVKSGAKDILTRLSNVLNEEIKDFRDLSLRQKSIAPEVLAEVCSDLIEEIKLSLDYLETEENISVKKLYSTGDLALSEGIAELFSKSLNVEILPFSILNSFSYSGSIKEELEKSEGNFAVALSSLL